MNPFTQSIEKPEMNRLSDINVGMIPSVGTTNLAHQKRMRQTMCERKRRYDKRGARSEINRFTNQRGRHGRPEKLRAYPCPVCAGWHLTKANHDNFDWTDPSNCASEDRRSEGSRGAESRD
jgi:hypothetical protein